MTNEEYHKPTQNKDGSVYCFCPELPNERIGVGLNWITKKAMCSVCKTEMEIKE